MTAAPTLDGRATGHLDTFAADRLPPRAQWPRIERTLPALDVPDRLNAAVELVDRAVAEHGADRLALLTPTGERWTYGDLQARTDQVAHVLTTDLGLAPGQRVLLRSPNTPWTVAAWLGTLKAGGVVVTTMPALRAGELAPLLTRTLPAVALVDHRVVDDLLEARDAHLPDLRVVPVGGDTDDDLVRRAAAHPMPYAAVDTSADDVALLAPTSGSTGVPKVTMHLHRDLLAIDATFGCEVLRLRPDDVVACSAPFAFTFGLGMLVVFPLRAGAASLLTEAAPPAVLAHHVHDRGATVLATAPTAWKQILKADLTNRLAGLRLAVSAGEHLEEATWHRLHERLGLDVVNGLGATELLHIVVSAAGPDIRPGAVGRAVPGYRLTVLDAEGHEVPTGTLGRLAVRGPVGCRYLDDERQASYVVDGWNVTGDTVRLDEDGYVWFEARSDDMIVSSGYNIGAPEVEAALDTHPAVLECGVVGKPDPDRGAVVCAFVVLADGVPADERTIQTLQDHVKGVLAPYKYPREVRFVPELPRNPSGKVQLFRLRQTIESEARA